MIFVPDIPEFAPIVAGAKTVPSCRVTEPLGGYWRIEADHEISLERRALKLGPALWNSALTGGFIGSIAEYGRDTLRIVDAA
jgi:hypothetical protein